MTIVSIVLVSLIVIGGLSTLTNGQTVNTQDETSARNNFVAVFQQLFSTLVGKAGLLDGSTLGLVGPPMTNSLRSLQSAADAAFFSAADCKYQFGQNSDITSLGASLQTPANQINILSSTLLVIGQGPYPQILIGLDSITNSMIQATSAASNSPPYTPCDGNTQNEIRESLVSFDNSMNQVIAAYTGSILR